MAKKIDKKEIADINDLSSIKEKIEDKQEEVKQEKAQIKRETPEPEVTNTK